MKTGPCGENGDFSRGNQCPKHFSPSYLILAGNWEQNLCFGNENLSDNMNPNKAMTKIFKNFITFMLKSLMLISLSYYYETEAYTFEIIVFCIIGP